ncbi:MAG TPA: F-box protein, partial [Candidatus Babeliales bacterium]|nr:F-box protein [Candidatus Babeliales bacterium]
MNKEVVFSSILVPKDIYAHIISYCDFQSIKRVSATCKELYENKIIDKILNDRSSVVYKDFALEKNYDFCSKLLCHYASCIKNIVSEQGKDHDKEIVNSY